ncbi:hypothetical protein FB451DRAFT_1190428 [Mycena latifolia]|nr:hypothetical protein FB451DRAFT_1190428 [Mycena latifolia]
MSEVGPPTPVSCPPRRWPLPSPARTIPAGHTAAPLEPLQHESATRWHHALCIRPRPPSALRLRGGQSRRSSPGPMCATHQCAHFQGISLNARCSWREECRSYNDTPPVSAELRLSVVPLARAPLERIGAASDALARSLRGGLDGTCCEGPDDAGMPSSAKACRRTSPRCSGIHGHSKCLIDEGVAANNGKWPVDKTGPWSIARSSAHRTTGEGAGNDKGSERDGDGAV